VSGLLTCGGGCADATKCPVCSKAYGRPASDAPAPPRDIESEIIARVDRWFGGGLCIAFKSHHEGRPNEPMTYLYRSDLLAGLGITENP
jgi:hypothetical protein